MDLRAWCLGYSSGVPRVLCLKPLVVHSKHSGSKVSHAVSLQTRRIRFDAILLHIVYVGFSSQPGRQSDCSFFMSISSVSTVFNTPEPKKWRQNLPKWDKPESTKMAPSCQNKCWHRMSLHGHATFVHFTHNVHICTCVTLLCKERDKVCQTRGPRWDHFSWKSNVSNCRGLFLPSLFNTWFLWLHFHIQALPTFIQTIGLTKYLFLHPWNAVHEKVVERGNSEPFTGHRGEWSACHLFLIQRHCVCSVCCTLTSGIFITYYQLHLFTTICSTLWQRTQWIHTFTVY